MVYGILTTRVVNTLITDKHVNSRMIICFEYKENRQCVNEYILGDKYKMLHLFNI